VYVAFVRRWCLLLLLLVVVVLPENLAPSHATSHESLLVRFKVCSGDSGEDRMRRMRRRKVCSKHKAMNEVDAGQPDDRATPVH
jgi:hypothetical protein